MIVPNAPRARVSIIINAAPADIFAAFVEPSKLAGFWLSSSTAPLSVGVPVQWNFMVPGAETETTATKLEPSRGIGWNWSDGTTVDVELVKLEGGTAVTVTNAGFQGNPDEIVDAALNATEGFAFVLADLKTMLETGASAHIVRDKARLIQLRSVPAAGRTGRSS